MMFEGPAQPEDLCWGVSASSDLGEELQEKYKS